MLRLDSVSRAHQRGATTVSVLRDVTLAVAPGEFVAVYGQRGAGKTTLLNIAAGLEDPDEGAVEFEGTALSGLGSDARTRLRRSAIGVVERRGPHSSELPVHTYVALPLYYALGARQAERRATAALERVGADDCGNVRWSNLGDEHRVLVALAQALVRQPRLVMADDPTAGLGMVDRERVLGLLRNAAEAEGLGVLITVPDTPSTLQAHRIHSLSRGRLLDATPFPPDDGGTVVQFPRTRRPA